MPRFLRSGSANATRGSTNGNNVGRNNDPTRARAAARTESARPRRQPRGSLLRTAIANASGLAMAAMARCGAALRESPVPTSREEQEQEQQQQQQQRLDVTDGARAAEATDEAEQPALTSTEPMQVQPTDSSEPGSTPEQTPDATTQAKVRTVSWAQPLVEEFLIERLADSDVETEPVATTDTTSTAAARRAARRTAPPPVVALRRSKRIRERMDATDDAVAEEDEAGSPPRKVARSSKPTDEVAVVAPAQTVLHLPSPPPSVPSPRQTLAGRVRVREDTPEPDTGDAPRPSPRKVARVLAPRQQLAQPSPASTSPFTPSPSGLGPLRAVAQVASSAPRASPKVKQTIASAPRAAPKVKQTIAPEDTQRVPPPVPCPNSPPPPPRRRVLPGTAAASPSPSEREASTSGRRRGRHSAPSSNLGPLLLETIIPAPAPLPPLPPHLRSVRTASRSPSPPPAPAPPCVAVWSPAVVETAFTPAVRERPTRSRTSELLGPKPWECRPWESPRLR